MKRLTKYKKVVIILCLAGVKTILDVCAINRRPKFPGESIPITSSTD
ncbi:MAG: hypothetical protein O7C75_14760 [Verrucomicrobia bacterium]|nr:hypothetical protein [Verrucomicrobiota bacterium]